MTAVDEPTLQERLAAVRAAAERDRRRSPEEAQRVLAARAAALARPGAAADDDAAGLLDLLLVRAGTEQLAIPVASIVAIARPGSIAPLPRAVRPVHGVTAWRGRTLTVLTLAAGEPSVSADSRLVVLGTGARASLAVLVDAVDDVGRTPRTALAPAGAGPRARYALGITPDGLLVVDGDALLHPELAAP